jgi:hypothetical protein
MESSLWKDPDFLHDLISMQRHKIQSLRGMLDQIAVVCTDNMDADKEHRMALDFMRQIATTERDELLRRGEQEWRSDTD